MNLRTLRLLSLVVLACFILAPSASGQLLVDFNQSNGLSNEPGYQSYGALHENAASFTTQSFTANLMGADRIVTLTPSWPNTTDNRVRQMIKRSAGQIASWEGNNTDLLADWIGVDSRTGNGGNGNWVRGVSGTPTYIDIALGGLPAGTYTCLSYHHDTENMWSDYQVEVSTDGGATFTHVGDGQITMSWNNNPNPPLGDQEAIVHQTGAEDPDPKNLSSTFTMEFTANGADDVVIRYAPYMDGVDPIQVHKQFFLLNGLEIDSVCETVDTWKTIDFNADDTWRKQPGEGETWMGVGVDADTCEIKVAGVGGDVWGGADSTTYAYEDANADDAADVVSGDFTATFTYKSFVKQTGDGTGGEWARAGLCFRSALEPNAAMFFAGSNGRHIHTNDPNQVRLSSIRRNNPGNNVQSHDIFNQNTPVEISVIREGQFFRSYYRYSANSQWLAWANYEVAGMPADAIYGFAVQNHGSNKSHPPFVGTFGGLNIDEGVVEVYNQVSVGYALAMGPVDNIEVTWADAVETVGTITGYRVKRNGVTIATIMDPAATSYVDTSAPADSDYLTYAIVPLDNSVPALEGAPATSDWSPDNIDENGVITAWLYSDHLNNTGGWQPADDYMRSDFLANADNSVNESNILPVHGTEVTPDYTIVDPPHEGNSAANHCVTCGEGNPVTFTALKDQSGWVDYSAIYGDINDVVSYMVCYLTNHTGGNILASFNLQSDDSHILLIDQTEWSFYKGCCGVGGRIAIIPPGEHRVMYKVFEGGGGHNGRVTITNGSTGQPFADGDISVSLIPTMTEVPEPMEPPAGMTVTGGITDWLLLGRYGTEVGCGTSPELMKQDFLAEADGITEANILPYVGMVVNTDFAVAASINYQGCAASGADPAVAPTVISVVGEQLNLEAVCANQDNVVTHQFTYIENLTGEDLVAEIRCGSDDGIAVALDNGYIHANPACRGTSANQDSAIVVITPGVHRLMMKTFEAGGGSGSQMSIRDYYTKVPYTADMISATAAVDEASVPMDSLPPAPTLLASRAMPCDAPAGTDLTVEITVNEPAYVVEQVAAEWGEPTNITGGGAYDPASGMIVWPAASGTVTYDVVVAIAPNLFGIALDAVPNTIPITGPSNLLVTTAVGDLSAADLGTTNAGSTVADAPDVGCLTITGSGADIWGNSDQFHYAYVESDAENYLIEATVLSFAGGTNAWSKAGLMFRDTCTANSAHSTIITRKDGHIHKQDRPVGGGGSAGEDNDTANHEFPIKLREIKIGDQITGYWSFWDAETSTWTEWGTSGVKTLPDEDGTGMYYVGLAVTSHNNNELSTAEFCDITMKPLTPPTVEVTADETSKDLCADMVTFALTAVTDDADGDDVTVQWAQPPGTVLQFPDPENVLQPNLLTQSTGEFVVVCTASDGILTTTTEITLTVNECPNLPPTITVEVDMDAADLCADSVVFTVTATADDPDLGIGDEITLAAEILNATNPEAVTVEETEAGVYAATSTDVGTFDVQVTVTDLLGESASASVSVTVNACPGENVFTGDCNCDGTVDLGDAISNLNYQFAEAIPCCLKNYDTNNDEKVDLADAISILNWMFIDGSMTAPNGDTLIGGAAVGCFFYTYEELGDLGDKEIFPCDAENDCTIAK